MSQGEQDKLENLFDFIANAPDDQEIIAMDCNDHCEEMAVLAERVARGEKLEVVMPRVDRYMKYWTHCREEFDALVVVIRAELADELPDLPAAEEDK